MDGFVFIREGRKTACVCEEGASIVAGALLHNIGCEPAERGGRGRLGRFAWKNGHGLIRTYRRGGLARHLPGDLFFLQNRALRELEIHRFVFANGLSVPEPLGACWHRAGLWFGGAIATREIDAADLAERLETMTRQGARAPDECVAQDDLAELMHSCGRLFRQMHDLGVFHADLHVGNVLVGANGPLILDFDKAFIVPRLSRIQRARNLFRFRRSLEKRGFPPPLFEMVCEGYGPAVLPGWMSRLYRTKGRLSDWASGRRISVA
ncbi:MAG TPA: lipopolysaccharide kinase InaA family protein [Candidatus Hydrogenedentes bacterium]|nr:lipopolysaccharide kinase InaA family protein [Candidatus Hydrogenedentota bacterium]HPC14854.1 lipopolysaccharide kinase InaA family protein [Candidatus Hydrogenedentota bacterium]HRT18718.1 lipopolysaccharide kinase InaA family protein [Candidatus Hydrogenedentota bacterium]HRT63738.1 lipopolysaccharide kinase InaA family protein [Candidatus Hydrogenedentota bacterium]